MTPNTAARAIEAALATAWGVTTPIAWPNVNFTPPATGSWIKVDFLWGNGSVATKDGRHRVPSILQLTLFGPIGAGDGPLYTLAETARAIFNGKRLASPNLDVMFGAMSGPVTIFDEAWRALAVSCPFTLEEVVP